MKREKTKLTDSMSLKTGKGFREGLYFDVNMHIQLIGQDGNIKQEVFEHNTVTTAGKNGVADQILASPTLAKVGWMAIGTGTPGATLLGAEVARVAFDTKTRNTNVITMVATFAAGTGTGAITEAGTFDVVTANTVNMWTSASFSVINKAAGDAMVITWTLTIS